MRDLKVLLSSMIALLLLGGAAAYAQDEAIKVEVDKITCREMLKMASDEREFTLIFMHGFISGKKGELLFDGPALTEDTDQILDACIGGPDETLLAVFEKVRG
ncbi:hypothetical protein GR183_18610 [Stappia sp. GBMRC 2046]|uniref:HdeA/HdeB family protein n=1 Tax=Stappia sediminis TaxID=2692190 RepID=A0A7X3S9M0_9HYPH|nr:HdeA/HdeB family chaperone [Stappia sediminis]MXN66930.1 hypothetical protein [Stappia sediminis]